ncbi:MAG TPA: hypothetical protein VI756_22735, partial [Blastocatellia bacterium]
VTGASDFYEICHLSSFCRLCSFTREKPARDQTSIIATEQPPFQGRLQAHYPDLIRQIYAGASLIYAVSKLARDGAER